MTASRFSILAALVVSASAAVLPVFQADQAHAEDAAGHSANGKWAVADSPTAVRKSLDVAVDKVAQEFNFVIREVARYKLQGATKVCQTYTIDVQDTVVNFACDKSKLTALKLDGTPLKTTNDDGEPITGTAAVSGDTVVIAWTGESGTRTNTFRRSGDYLVLSAKVTSEQMPKPLEWSIRYKSTP